MAFSIASTYDDLAAGYERYGASASPELYATLREVGLAPDARVLDVGVGTGLASEPLAREGALITGIDPAGAMLRYAKARLPRAQLVQGRAEALPFPAASFDAAIAADVFHLLDGPVAIGELVRVVRKGGLVAVWWQTLSTESDVLGHRAGATHDTGLDPVPEPLGPGFRAFYGGDGFADRTVRAIPALIRTTVDDWMGLERARAELRAAYGTQSGRWLDALENRLVSAYGARDAHLDVRTVQYLYLGRIS